ncbi:MAG: XrtA system polysaccharide chain length determinant [Alteripontixanthobacter sp.]
MNEVFEEFRAAIHSVWHRRWLALAIAWGVCVLGWLIVALIPNSYESKARIFVQVDDVLVDQTNIASTAEDDILRVRQTLASKVNLEKVVKSTALGKGLTTQGQLDQAIDELAEDTIVKSEEDNLFELIVTVGEGHLSEAENARLSQEVVQKLIDVFREENIAGNRGELAETVVFLDQQLNERKLELEEAEQRRLQFEAQHPELIGGAGGVSGRIAQARSESRSVSADLAAAQSALAAIEGQLSNTPRTIAGSPAAMGGARGALAQAEANLGGLRARGLTANHPDVISAQRQVNQLRQAVAAEGPQGSSAITNPAYSSLLSIRAERQANVQALQSRSAAIQSEMGNLMADQANEPGVAAEMTRISRDYEVLRNKYDELLADREKLRFRGDVENNRSSFRFDVIDPPSVPRVPAAPNRLLLLLGVLFAGLGAGVAGSLAMSRLRSTFSTAGKLERVMELPVIGTVSKTMTEAARAQHRKKLKIFAAATASLGGLFVLLMGIEILTRSTGA